MTNTKMICAFLVVFLGWMSFAAAEETQKFPKPDYSQLQGKDFDPRLETAIEGMRIACHDFYVMYRETGGDWTRNYRSNVHYLRKVLCMYALLLHEAELDRTIDELSRDDGLNDLVFDWYDMGPEGYTFRDYVKNRSAFKTLEEEKKYRQEIGWKHVEQLRIAGIDGRGFFSFPFQHPIDLYDMSGHPFIFIQRDYGERPKYRSFSEGVMDIVKTGDWCDEEMLDDAAKILDTISLERATLDQIRFCVTKAVVFAAMDRQTDADKAWNIVMAIADAMLEKSPDEWVLENIALGQLKTKRYDEVEKTVDRWKTLHFQAQDADDDKIRELTRTWNEKLGEMMIFLACEGELERALRWCDQWMDSRQDKVYLSVTHEASLHGGVAGIMAKQGRKEELQQLLALKTYPEWWTPEWRFDCAMYHAKTGSKETALEELRSLLKPTTIELALYEGVPDRLDQINTLGIMFAKLDDNESAEKFLQLADGILHRMVGVEYYNSYSHNISRVLAERYKQGLKVESFAFFRTYCEDFRIFNSLADFVDKIANVEGNEADAVEMLEILFDLAPQLEKISTNPETLIAPGPSSEPTYRDFAYGSIARAALMAGQIDFAKQAIREVELLASGYPAEVGFSNYPLNQAVYGQTISANTFCTLMTHQRIDEALFAAERLKDHYERFFAYRDITMTFLRGSR